MVKTKRTHEVNTTFSAAIKSCKGLSASFPISAGTGIVELWAIFTVALLNIAVGVQALLVTPFGGYMPKFDHTLVGLEYYL